MNFLVELEAESLPQVATAIDNPSTFPVQITTGPGDSKLPVGGRRRVSNRPNDSMSPMQNQALADIHLGPQDHRITGTSAQDFTSLCFPMCLMTASFALLLFRHLYLSTPLPESSLLHVDAQAAIRTHIAQSLDRLIGPSWSVCASFGAHSHSDLRMAGLA
jgi:hypothetical protein